MLQCCMHSLNKVRNDMSASSFYSFKQIEHYKEKNVKHLAQL
jgi:hypothetical protein